MAGTRVVESAPGWMLPVIFNPTSTLLPVPTTTRGTNEENLLTASESVGLKLTSSSAYTLPLSSTSVLGTLKIVCCACASEKAPKKKATGINNLKTLQLILTKSSCIPSVLRIVLRFLPVSRYLMVSTDSHLKFHRFNLASDY